MKVADICYFVVHDNIDILAIQEFWLHGDECDNCTIAKLKAALSDYKLHQSSRRNKGGGGVCFILKKGYKGAVNSTKMLQVL